MASTPEAAAVERVLRALRRASISDLHALAGTALGTDVIAADSRRYIVEYAVVRRPEGLVVGAVAFPPKEGRAGRAPTLHLVRPDGRWEPYTGNFEWPVPRPVLQDQAVEFCRAEMRAVRGAAMSELVAQADHGFVAHTVALAGGPVYTVERYVMLEKAVAFVTVEVSVQLAASAWSQPLAVGHCTRDQQGEVLEETVESLDELSAEDSTT